VVKFRPRAVLPPEISPPSTACTVGWVDPRACLYDLEKAINFRAPIGVRTSDLPSRSESYTNSRGKCTYDGVRIIYAHDGNI